MWKLGLGTMLAVTTYAQADAGGIALAELPRHVTEGRVTIDATPAEIYDLVTDYRAWRSVLSDIRSVEVERGDREHARVRFNSRALRNTVTVQFNNEPGRTIRFAGIKGPPGGRARGEYHLLAVDQGARTLVVARLYMDVVGAPAIFVRDKTIRELRRAKLTADLADLANHFARR